MVVSDDSTFRYALVDVQVDAVYKGRITKKVITFKMRTGYAQDCRQDSHYPIATMGECKPTGKPENANDPDARCRDCEFAASNLSYIFFCSYDKSGRFFYTDCPASIEIQNGLTIFSEDYKLQDYVPSFGVPSISGYCTQKYNIDDMAANYAWSNLTPKTKTRIEVYNWLAHYSKDKKTRKLFLTKAKVFQKTASFIMPVS